MGTTLAITFSLKISSWTLNYELDNCIASGQTFTNIFRAFKRSEKNVKIRINTLKHFLYEGWPIRRRWEQRKMRKYTTWLWSRRREWKVLRNQVTSYCHVVQWKYLKYILPLGNTNYSTNTGGFVGIDQLTSWVVSWKTFFKNFIL